MNKQMIPTKGYIYVRYHEAYDKYHACKLGKATNIPERDSTYATGEIKRGYFDLVFEVPFYLMNLVERMLQKEFNYLNIKCDAGTEFYNKEIISLIETYIISLNISYKRLERIEIDNLIRTYRVRTVFKKINRNSLIKLLKTTTLNRNYIWNERDYQREIIEYGINELLTENKIYIELPTGGGKSYIVYNLFETLKSDFIVIISPRKIVNCQNISQKYLQILTENYKTFNYSIDTNFDDFLKLENKKIVICCTKSVSKIYEKLITYGVNNITTWFDEAHWGVEEWVHTISSNNILEFWLLNNTLIKYRIFTSASPDKPLVLANENIFGKLYAPIKVKELIRSQWLAPIKPYVYSENKINVDNIKFIINDFNERNRKYGFSFHNKQKNAFNLFYKHYIQYKNNETYIKPFLLVSDNFTIEIEPRLNDICLDYNFRNISIYEKNINSIGYVVAKYSMGYDFKKLDFIYLSDPKLSIQDIKQCIGRGIRPDELGDNGSNKDKELVISLPVYIDENGDNKYEKIIEVLKYLLYDIEIAFEDIEFKNRYTPSFKERNGQSTDYIGIEDVKSVLLDLLELENRKMTLDTTYEKARKIIVEKNINNWNHFPECYYELCDRDNRLSKEPDVIFKGKFTNWIDYLGIERVYYDLSTCKNKINEYLSIYPELKKNHMNLSIIVKKMCETDPLFPPDGLWVDYYGVKDLRNIISIGVVSNKKKIITVI